MYCNRKRKFKKSEIIFYDDGRWVPCAICAIAIFKDIFVGTRTINPVVLLVYFGVCSIKKFCLRTCDLYNIIYLHTTYTKRYCRGHIIFFYTPSLVDFPCVECPSRYCTGYIIYIYICKRNNRMLKVVRYLINSLSRGVAMENRNAFLVPGMYIG